MFEKIIKFLRKKRINHLLKQQNILKNKIYSIETKERRKIKQINDIVYSGYYKDKDDIILEPGMEFYEIFRRRVFVYLGTSGNPPQHIACDRQKNYKQSGYTLDEIKFGRWLLCNLSEETIDWLLNGSFSNAILNIDWVRG